jgi:hypothetical protein
LGSFGLVLMIVRVRIRSGTKPIKLYLSQLPFIAPHFTALQHGEGDQGQRREEKGGERRDFASSLWFAACRTLIRRPAIELPRQMHSQKGFAIEVGETPRHEPRSRTEWNETASGTARARRVLSDGLSTSFRPSFHLHSAQDDSFKK